MHKLISTLKPDPIIIYGRVLGINEGDAFRRSELHSFSPPLSSFCLWAHYIVPDPRAQASAHACPGWYTWHAPPPRILTLGNHIKQRGSKCGDIISSTMAGACLFGRLW
ncbi:hypothetical protein BOTBODRAFT_553293 [Botryobasidium botryosum FD-172 SS1]|uniref:Uncharacterized protein n=1 Tax=Botryobasidium botryosum (strain FD-172 SS1) TaxID=930990 RepID=A0A067N347_BOTB1|nr:hypothetical protein BOTBODRAFT_553293 [Botryobasidium botryosum FD-172 SS1]